MDLLCFRHSKGPHWPVLHKTNVGNVKRQDLRQKMEHRKGRLVVQVKSIHLHPRHLQGVSCRGTGPPPPPQGADTQNLSGGSCLVQAQAESKQNVPTNAPLRVGATGSRSLLGLGRVPPNLPSAAVFPLSLFPRSPNPSLHPLSPLTQVHIKTGRPSEKGHQLF